MPDMKVAVSFGDLSTLAVVNRDGTTWTTCKLTEANFDDNDIQLYQDSEKIFQNLQDRVQRGQVTADELTYVSCHYRSALKASIVTMQNDVSFRDRLTKKIQLYESMLLAWHLAELIFLQSADKNIVDSLVSWVSQNFMYAEAVDELKSDWQNAHRNAKYWDLFSVLCLTGRLAESVELLQLHPYKKEPAFLKFISLVKTVRNDQQGTCSPTWRSTASRSLLNGDFAEWPQLESIIGVFCGKNTDFSGFRHLFTEWYELFAAFVFCQHAIPGHFDKLIQQSKQYLKPANANIDRILVSILNFDSLETVKCLSDSLPNWWMSLHLADLFSAAGNKLLDEIKSEVSLRDFLLVEYASNLMSNRTLRKVGVRYLKQCTSANMGVACAERLLETQRYLDDAEVLEAIDLCLELKLEKTVKTLCREHGVEALKRGNLENALKWCVEGKDCVLANEITERYFDDYGKTGLFRGIQLLDHLGDAVLLSPALAFLVGYREFHKLYEAQKLEDAAKKLISLVRSRIAPLKFSFILLLDALPLLGDEDEMNPIFNCEDTYELLDALESYVDSKKLLKQRIGNENEVMHIRRALISNLSLAIATRPINN